MYASRRVPKGFRHEDGYLQLIHEADRGEGEVGYLAIRSAVERVDDDQLFVEFPDRREDARPLDGERRYVFSVSSSRITAGIFDFPVLLAPSTIRRKSIGPSGSNSNPPSVTVLVSVIRFVLLR